jgi:hypothetical protein
MSPPWSQALKLAGSDTISSHQLEGSRMGKVIFSLFLLVFAVPAWADKQQDQSDQKNVYDAFDELKLEPSAGVAFEENVTSRIKRYMASLMYPVDLTSFVRPEKDPKLRDLIFALQKQMGEVANGVLTYDQFSRLQDAALSIDERSVAVAPGKFVYRSDDGNVVTAKGTGVMNDLANPININRMFCSKSDGTCEMSGAEFDLKHGMLIAPAPTIFEIKTWTPGRVTAIREHPCGTALLTVDVKTEEVTITSTPHADLPFCSTEPATIWRLADGFKITWNLYRDRYNKARELIYEPAKKIFPIRVPAN